MQEKENNTMVKQFAIFIITIAIVCILIFLLVFDAGFGIIYAVIIGCMLHNRIMKFIKKGKT